MSNSPVHPEDPLVRIFPRNSELAVRSKQPAEIADVVALPGGAGAEPAHRVVALRIRDNARRTRRPARCGGEPTPTPR